MNILFLQKEKLLNILNTFAGTVIILLKMIWCWYFELEHNQIFFWQKVYGNQIIKYGYFKMIRDTEVKALTLHAYDPS